MKPLLVVDSHVAEATKLAERVYDVVSYAQATKFRLKDRAVLYWPEGNQGSKRAARLAKWAAEVKRLIAEGKTPADMVAMTWKEFVEWAKPRVLEPELVEDDPPPTPSQKESVDKIGLACMESGNPYCNAANVLRFLTNTPEYAKHIWFDDFHSVIMTDLRGKPERWSDSDENELMIHLQDKFAFHRLTDKHVKAAISFFAEQDHRHEVRDWIKSLQWDKTPRVSEFFLNYCGAERTGANRAFSYYFWVLMLRRIFNPGCQADYMVVLEGAQGTGKTRTFQTIGGEWYGEIGINANDRDFERQLQGRIIAEISELQSFTKADQSRIKQIITKRNDIWVEKYKEYAKDHRRPCILVGTTNETEWIKDQTGGRRFWPIKTGSIDIDAIKTDREQLFAEAYQASLEEPDGVILPALETADLQDQRRERDAWEDVLREALIGRERVTRYEAMMLIGIPAERMDPRAERRTSYVLRQLGWKSKSFTISGESQRYWVKNGSQNELSL